MKMIYLCKGARSRLQGTYLFDYEYYICLYLYIYLYTRTYEYTGECIYDLFIQNSKLPKVKKNVSRNMKICYTY